MKHILLFNNESEYQAAKDTLSKPYVCYIEDEEKVIYQENDIIEFVDEAARTIMLNLFDADSNGEITKTEALMNGSWPSTSPFASNKNITDMSFIKYFKNFKFPVNAQKYFQAMINCKIFDLSGVNFTNTSNINSFFASAQSCEQFILKNCDFSNVTRMGAMFNTSQASSNITIDFTGSVFNEFSNLVDKGNFVNTSVQYTIIADKCSTTSLDTIEKMCALGDASNITILYNGSRLIYRDNEWIQEE